MVLAVSIVACGGNGKKNTQENEAATASTEMADDSTNSAAASTSGKQTAESESGASDEPATGVSAAGSENGDAAEPQTASSASTGQGQEGRPSIAGNEIPITDVGPLLIGQTENKTAATGCRF